jgi:hypothetical protein
VTDKAEVVRQLEEAWRELTSLVDSIPESRLEIAGVSEDWSVKDLLGHMAFWGERATKTLRAINAGRPDDIAFGSGENWVDEWNRREYVSRKDRSLDEIRTEWARAFDEAERALAETPPQKLDEPFQHHSVVQYFAGDTYEHYNEHADQIRTWLRQLETTEA